ncbi:hypothetical protein KKG48_02765 [Patescibacteria group bacterium]|nr:hypothetical protein [Patescibacteria group bacterium]MCG2695179.1 hypothetical protein [Candidatus Parcubacteria bacterium]
MNNKIILIALSIIILSAGIYYYFDWKNKGDGCVQVITYAQNPKTGECEIFPNPCVVPKNWEACEVNNFEDCVKMGNPVMESYPRQCRSGENVFSEKIASILSQKDALGIAQKNKECSSVGVLTDKTNYNEITKTWWIDLERKPGLESDGCNPACVVNEETETAEVNWRCTGLIFEKD